MSKKQKLELTRIGKEHRPRLEPRILLDDTRQPHPGKKRGQPLRITQSQLREVGIQVGFSAAKIKPHCKHYHRMGVTCKPLALADIPRHVFPATVLVNENESVTRPAEWI